MNRERLAEIPAGTELLRAVRHMADAEFDDCTIGELDNAVRWLRAASYSAAEGARRIETVIQRRHNERSEPCHAQRSRSTPAQRSTVC